MYYFSVPVFMISIGDVGCEICINDRPTVSFDLVESQLGLLVDGINGGNVDVVVVVGKFLAAGGLYKSIRLVRVVA